MDSSRRLAITLRMLVCGMSLYPPSAAAGTAAGAAAFGAAATGAAAAAAATGAVCCLGAAAAASMCACTSDLTMRLFGPVPATPDRLTPDEAANARASGLANTRAPDDAAAVDEDEVDDDAAAAAVGAAAAAAAATGAAALTEPSKSFRLGTSAASSASTASTVPIVTSEVPLGTRILAR